VILDIKSPLPFFSLLLILDLSSVFLSPNHTKITIHIQHPNANITFQQKEVEEMVDTMILMEGGGGGGGGDSGGANSDSTVADIAQKIQARMPAEFDLRKCHASTFSKNAKNGQMNSLGVFVSQELIRFNQLMKVISKSLVMLQKAIKGFVVMSESLEMIYNCFLLQRVPEEWESAGYPCLKPLASWTEDFYARLDFVGSWLTNGPPKSYWISGLFFPQGFMTAVRLFFLTSQHAYYHPP
jgi:dynein heavy chain